MKLNTHDNIWDTSPGFKTSACLFICADTHLHTHKYTYTHTLKADWKNTHLISQWFFVVGSIKKSFTLIFKQKCAIFSANIKFLYQKMQHLLWKYFKENEIYLQIAFLAWYLKMCRITTIMLVVQTSKNDQQ